MRFGLGQRRTATATRNLSYALVAVTVGLIAITTAFYSQAALPAYPSDHSSSSLASSPSVSSGTSSTTAQPAVQPANQSAAQYPLVWGANPPTVCGDRGICFINATLALSNGTLSISTTTATTTIINNKTTTIEHGYTTLIIRGNATDGIYGSPPAFETVAVTAYVRDAMTGQNVTTSSGLTVITYDCDIPRTGFASCLIGGEVPTGHTYKVTLYVTKTYLPCSLRPAEPANLSCEQQLLAPPSQTITVAG
jgi:hypothetical protein